MPILSNRLNQSSSSPPPSVSNRSNPILFLTLLSLTLCHSFPITTSIGTSTTTVITSIRIGQRPPLPSLTTTTPSFLPKQHTLRPRPTDHHHHHHHHPRSEPIDRIGSTTTRNSISSSQSTHPDPTQTNHSPPTTNTNTNTNTIPNNRRLFLSKTVTTTSILLLLFQPQPTTALQQRNEALCQTGFFEHYNEYRCTPIGDISDEGRTKSLSDQEERVSSGLLDKLDVGGGGGSLSGVFDEEEEGGSGNGNGSGKRKKKKMMILGEGNEDTRNE